MKKKLISLLLVLCMVTTLLPMSVMAVAFDDTSEHWAKTSIQRLADKNVVQGTLGKFRPDDTITRAEVAQIFDNLMDYQTATDKEYTDLTKDAWYAASMKKAAAAGVFAGGGDGTINPLGQMTRQEFFVTLARVLQLPDSTKIAPFSDSPNIADWARPKVNALVEAGLLQGIKNADGSFAAKPLQTITRAEVITMLDRAFPGIYNSADTYTQPVTGNAVVSAPGVKLDGVTVSGDLFIAPGVANGEATLHNAKVAGRTMVYGGGKNSLILNGETALESLTAAKAALEDPLTIKLFDKATVKTITVVNGSAKTTVIVNAGATLDRLVIENDGTEVQGDGTVKVIVVTANNTVITVPNARIEVAAGVTGTMVGGKSVAGGTTVTSNSTGTGTKRPGGGNSDPVGPVEPPQPAGTWAVRFETNGGEKIAPIYVVKNLKLDPVPQAAKKDSLFLGWYTDAALATQFFASEVLTKDVTLYAKYQAMEKKQEQKVDSFALSEVMPAQTFTVSAIGMTPEQVRNAITVTNVGAGGTPELKITDNKDSTFTVSADGGFRTGSAVTLHLGDGVSFAENDAQGNPMSSEIRNASFTVRKEEANNMKLSDDLTRVKIDSKVVQDITDPTQVTEGGVTTTTGSFTVIGNELGGKALAIGEMYVLYENVAPEARTDITKDYSKDTIIYAKIKTVDSDPNKAGNQVIYDVVEDSELMNMPESLPLDVADFVAGSYTGKDDLDFVISNKLLRDTDTPNANVEGSTYTGYWADYDHIGLSNNTTIDVGDTVVLMGVGITTPGADVEDANVVYGTVATVTPGETNTTVTFTLTTAEAVMANKQDFYSQQPLDYKEMAEKATAADIPAQIEKQAMESGFVEDAMTYLTEVATKTDGFKEVASRAGPNMDIGTPGFGDGWQPNVQLPKSLAKGFTVKAKITDNGDHYGGLMCQLYVEGKVEIPTDPKAAYPDKLVIDMKATFEQELKISVNMDGGIEWSWAGPIPYPSDIYVNTNVDVYDYTAIKVQAQVTTKGGSDVLHGALEDIKDVNITKEIQELLEMPAGDKQMAGTEKLFAMYGAMLETETDYITLVEQEIFNQGGTYYGILAYGVKGDFVIAANVNLVIGSSLEYESGNRYNFWFKLFSGTSGSSTTRLIDEQMKFQFYIMGTIGLKVGISLEIFVAISPGGKCNLASIGFGVDVGAYVDLYGYFVYEVKSLNQVTTSEMAGALYVDFGIYLEIYFFARAGEDIAGGLAEYQPTLFDKKWPLISAGEKINVYDFTYKEIPAEEKYIIKNYTTDYLPDSYWSMKGMDLLSGDLVDLIYPRDRFVYTLSNPAFKFDAKKGQVEVTVPDNTRYMECDMTIKWVGAKLAFSTEDLVRTVHLVWTNLADEEMSLRHNISVVADGKVIWSKVVGEGEQYTLPETKELKELLEYDKFIYTKGNTKIDLKYDTANSALTYKNQDGDDNTLLVADRDLIYTVNVTPRVYELPIKEVQNPDGTPDASFVLTGKFGEPLDLTDLLDSGTSDDAAEKPYTVYARTECVETKSITPKDGETPPEQELTAPVGRPLDAPIDVGFAKQILDGTFTYTAQYNDNFVTATYNFVNSRGKLLGTISVEVENDTVSNFDYYDYVTDPANNISKAAVEGGDAAITYMPKRFSPADTVLTKLTDDAEYTIVCVIAMGTPRPLNFKSVADGVVSDFDPLIDTTRYFGALLALPQVECEGYSFAGWYTDQELTKPFTATNMPNKEVTPAADPLTGEILLVEENKAETMTVEEDPSAELGILESQPAAEALVAEALAEDPGVTLYAKWNANIYNVSFDTNAAGSSLSGATPKDITATFDAAYNGLLDGTMMRRSNYKLLGWSLDKQAPLASDATEEEIVAAIDDTCVIAEDHTLYAVWQLKTRIPDDYFVKTPNPEVTYAEKVAHPFVLKLKNSSEAVQDNPATEEDETKPAVPGVENPDYLNKTFTVQYKGRNPNYSANRWLTYTADAVGETPANPNVGPVDAETYDVMLYRPEDENHQLFKQVIPEGVVINQLERTNYTIAKPSGTATVSPYAITVYAATYTGPGAGDGRMQYHTEQYAESTKIQNSDGGWTDSLTVPIADPQNYLQNDESRNDSFVQRVTCRYAGGRNYKDTPETTEYLSLAFSNIPKISSVGTTKMPFSVTVQTGDSTGGGTGSNVYFEINGHSKNILSNQMNGTHENDFERNTTHTFNYETTTDPWAIKDVSIFKDLKEATSEAWHCKYFEYTFNNLPKSVNGGTVKQKASVEDWIKEGNQRTKAYMVDPNPFKRTITDVGTFANWNGTHEVSEKSNGKISYGYNGSFTDQYGKYDAYMHREAPTLRVGTIDKYSKFVVSPFADCISYSNYGIEIDEAKLYARMAAAEIPTVSFIVKLDVPTASRTNAADDKMFTQTITVNRVTAPVTPEKPVTPAT